MQRYKKNLVISIALVIASMASKSIAQTAPTATSEVHSQAAVYQPSQPDVTDVTQPAQTTQEVIQAAQAGVRDAMRDVDEKANQVVEEQTAAMKRLGRRDIRIMYGSALVNARPAEGKWGDARVIAYQRAVMQAREKLLKQLYSEVSSEMVRESFRTNQLPEFTDTELKSQAGMEAALDMIVAVADTALEGRVEAMGIDSKAYAVADSTKRKIMMKKAFSKKTSTSSRGEISGTIVTRTFETTDVNGNTAVSVVLTTSNKMKNTLENLRLSKGSIAPDPSKARISIEDYLSQNQSNLMYQYGMSLIYDEMGYPVLISYAQAGNECNPVNYEECVDNRDFAFIEAENDAFSHFAEAYQLTGNIQTDTSKGEEKIKDATLTKTEDGQDIVESTVTQILKETQQMSRQTASIKNLVGIKEVMRWTENHPVTNKEINGIVLAWHPMNEQSIRAYKANKPKAQPKQQRSGRTAPIQGNQGSGMDTFNASDF